MPFYRKYGWSGDDFDLRNDSFLETGFQTETEFTYAQFVRNCVELKHFGYYYEKMYGYMPRYVQREARVRPELLRLEIKDKRLMASPLLQKADSKILRMDFRCSGTGEMVFLFIAAEFYDELRDCVKMWLSKDPESWKMGVQARIFHTEVTYCFEEPVFGVLLKKYGLLREEGQKTDDGIH